MTIRSRVENLEWRQKYFDLLREHEESDGAMEALLDDEEGQRLLARLYERHRELMGGNGNGA